MIDEDATQLLECEKRLLDAFCKPQEQLPDVIHKILSWYGGSFSKWISVHDRLPDEDGTYIIFAKCTDGEFVSVFPYKKCSKFHPYPVSHWMPLPEQPK